MIELSIIGGTVRAIYNDDLADLLREGYGNTVRASHVEPWGNASWTADMGPVNGPVLGPFPTHAQAIEAETEWLKNNLGL